MVGPCSVKKKKKEKGKEGKNTVQSYWKPKSQGKKKKSKLADKKILKVK